MKVLDIGCGTGGSAFYMAKNFGCQGIQSFNQIHIICTLKCLVFWSLIIWLRLLMPCPSAGPKMFCASPNLLGQTKNGIAFSADPKILVRAQKLNLIDENHLLVWHKKFGTSTICKSIFGLAQKIWVIPKHFGTCKRTRHYWFPLIPKYIFQFESI